MRKERLREKERESERDNYAFLVREGRGERVCSTRKRVKSE